jgi:pre-mRNA-splicing helicase BRR2
MWRQLQWEHGNVLKCFACAGSYRVSKKGYEEFHVPALKPKPFEDKEKLRAISDLPEWARLAFVGMKELNRVQVSLASLLCAAPLSASQHCASLLCASHLWAMVSGCGCCSCYCP